MKVSVIVCAAALLLPASVAHAQGVSDAQIASIVVTANQVDIDAGTLAHATSANTAIKTFAQQMITAHTGVNASAVALVTRLKVTPEVDKTLIPDAKNAELKALLVSVRPAFVAHLDHAKHIQSTLGK